jgi:hypothetical protein
MKRNDKNFDPVNPPFTLDTKITLALITLPPAIAE